MHKIGLVFNGVWSHYAFATAPKYADIYRLIYIHELTDETVDGLEALVVPFQSNQTELGRRRSVIYNLLAHGKKVFAEGDSTADWLDAVWEDRPVNNYWWVTDPHNPPVSETDFDHPVYNGLSKRHSCWHTHGAYVSIPDQAAVIQRKPDGDIITWETRKYGGVLMATTLDPIVEHGVQQITHLDHYVDSLTHWLCGIRPEGRFEVPKERYGITA